MIEQEQRIEAEQKIEVEQRIEIIRGLERSFEKKEEQLPKSIATFIRRLKQSEKFEEAMLEREREKEKRRRMARTQRAAERLNETKKILIETDSPEKQLEYEVSAIW